MPKIRKPVDQEQKRMVEEIGAEIVLKLTDQFFEVDGVPLATVKYQDGLYKKKPLIAGHLFSLTSVYTGAKGQAIFCFEPEDAQEYKLAEMDCKGLDEIFPLFGGAVATAYGLDTDVVGESITKVMAHIIGNRAQMELDAKEAERLAAVAHYKNNSLFGRF